MVVHVVDVIAGLIAVGLIFIGARFVLSPQAAAAGYGVDAPDGPGVRAYLSVKGGRDITFGLVTLGMLVAAPAHVFGLLLIIESVAAIADGIIVLANKGKPAIAFGVHWATAAVCIVLGVLLLMV